MVGVDYDEFCEKLTALDVTTRTLLEYLKSGRLKGVKIGASWKISPENLRRFIEGGEKGQDDR